MQAETTESQDRKQLTPEEMKVLRDQTISSYKDEMELLEVIDSYERLRASIEESRTKRMALIMRQAQMAAGPDEKEAGEPPVGETEGLRTEGGRKLKAKH